MEVEKINISDPELIRLLDEVAAAVGLQEGGTGVHGVLRAFQQLDPASTRAVSRHTGLPLPVVAAVNNELRSRDLVTRDRPSRLTARGQALAGEPTQPVGLPATCGCCAGHTVTVPPVLAAVADQLAELMTVAPAADPTLDQSHCTVETKLHRVLLLIRYGLLPGRGLLLLGDDDLMALTVALVGAALGRPLVDRLAVVDVSADLLAFTADRLAALGSRTGGHGEGGPGFTTELIEQDLREPLDQRLRGGFDLVMTDPPYTADGARLFLSRAVSALRPGPGRAIMFSFGPKGPADTLRVQETVTELGLTVQAIHRDFNSYHGAGVIGGRSHLQYLASTERTAPIVTDGYTGPLYTAEQRGADRAYQCLDCRARQVVGPTAGWKTVAMLRDAGCPSCGGHRFRPRQLVREG